MTNSSKYSLVIVTYRINVSHYNFYLTMIIVFFGEKNWWKDCEKVQG